MRKSELLDSFIKIATDKGLLSEKPSKSVKAEPTQRSDVFENFAEMMSTAEPEHTEKEGKVRWDSLSIEQIGKLYNTKPELPEDMKYEHNIMEDAHPDTLVISPAHDKINGLIENNIEGQNIRMRIVMKTPNGHLTQHKYAQKDLILSLVSLGNKLDNSDQEDLCKLADTCLLQVGGFQKQAWIVPVLIGVLASLGALYTQQHLRFHSDGFTNDYQKTINEIDDLLHSNSNWGVGYSYTPAFIQTLNNLKTVLAELNTEVEKIIPVLNKWSEPHTKPELEQMLQQSDTQEVPRLLDEYHQEIKKIMPFLQTVVRDFGDEGYKQRAIADKGALTSLIDAPEFLHGGKTGLIADDFDDVARALGTLFVDISNIDKSLQGYQDTKQSIEDKLTQAEEQPKTEEAVAPSAPTAPTEGAPESALEELGGL